MDCDRIDENFIADPFANSHETPIDEKEPEVVVVWLGDEKEKALTEFFEGFIPRVGWYWILFVLPPHGPFSTSKEAKDDYDSYMAEK
jgi:hypothetical protein